MSFSNLLQRFGRSPAFKFIVICLLILLLMIPLLFVWSLTSERKGYASRAANEVSKAWSGPQNFRGPVIIVPVKKKEITRRQNKDSIITDVTKYAIFLPEEVDISAKVDTKELKRGIFTIPVYHSELSFKGRFEVPDLKRIEREFDEIVWADAVLATMISDVRGIKKTAELKLGSLSYKFRPGLGSGIRSAKGIHVPLTETQAKEGFPFEFALDVNGSKEIGFVPSGGETKVAVNSNWPHPSFDGAFLPEKRDISDDGFSANWSIPRLARGEGQSFVVNGPRSLLQNTLFNVRFYQPVGFYNLVDRSLKYALGFISIIFLSVFVLEILARKRVHWIQYVFVGLALIIFYLVLLGLSEHIGFEWAYLLAASATATLVGLYGGSAFKSSARGIVLFFVLATIYGLLYLLLRVEDYAMLIGSIAAFVLLSIVMYFTRNVDWGAATGDDAPDAT